MGNNKNINLILLFYLFLLTINECANDSLNKIQNSKLKFYNDIKNLKKSKRNLEDYCQELFEDDANFDPLNIYIDELCLKEELKTDLNSFIEIIKNSMNNAAKILQKILKVNAFVGNPLLSDDQVKQHLGVNVWNNKLIGDGREFIGDGMFSRGYHYIVYTKVAERNTMGEKIATSRIILNDGDCGQPIIGTVTLNPDIDYSQIPSSYLDYIMVHQFTHLLGFHKTFINPKIDEDSEEGDFISPIKEDNSNSGHYYVDSENVIKFADRKSVV